MWAGHRRRSDEHLGADVVSCRLGLEVGACGGRRKPLLALLSRRCANSWQQEGLSQADPGSSSLMFSCKGFGSQQLIGKKSLQRMLGITTLEHILSGLHFRQRVLLTFPLLLMLASAASSSKAGCGIPESWESMLPEVQVAII